MLQISIPFAGLSFMLKKLAETPMPIVTTQEMPLRRELTPVILPVNLDEVTDSFTVSDQEQGIKVVTGLMKTQRPFAELLGKDSQNRSKNWKNSPMKCLINSQAILRRNPRNRNTENGINISLSRSDRRRCSSAVLLIFNCFDFLGSLYKL